MWGPAVSNPPHYHYVQGVPQGGPSGPILSGPSTRHLRPQSSYSLPHGSNGLGRWGWSGSNVSSFDRRQLKVPPQPARPAPVRPSASQHRNVGNSVSYMFYNGSKCLYASERGHFIQFKTYFLGTYFMERCRGIVSLTS